MQEIKKIVDGCIICGRFYGTAVKVISKKEKKNGCRLVSMVDSLKKGVFIQNDSIFFFLFQGLALTYIWLDVISRPRVATPGVGVSLGISPKPKRRKKVLYPSPVFLRGHPKKVEKMVKNKNYIVKFYFF